MIRNPKIDQHIARFNFGIDLEYQRDRLPRLDASVRTPRVHTETLHLDGLGSVTPRHRSLMKTPRVFIENELGRTPYYNSTAIEQDCSSPAEFTNRRQ